MNSRFINEGTRSPTAMRRVSDSHCMVFREPLLYRNERLPLWTKAATKIRELRYPLDPIFHGLPLDQVERELFEKTVKYRTTFKRGAELSCQPNPNGISRADNVFQRKNEDQRTKTKTKKPIPSRSPPAWRNLLRNGHQCPIGESSSSLRACA